MLAEVRNLSARAVARERSLNRSLRQPPGGELGFTLTDFEARCCGLAFSRITNINNDINGFFSPPHPDEDGSSLPRLGPSLFVGQRLSAFVTWHCP